MGKNRERRFAGQKVRLLSDGHHRYLCRSPLRLQLQPPRLPRHPPRVR